MKILYLAKLNKDKPHKNLRKDVIVEVTSELCPGSMTGCDSFRQGWVTDLNGHRHIETFDYFELDKL